MCSRRLTAAASKDRKGPNKHKGACLRETAHAEEAVHGAAALVAVHCSGPRGADDQEEQSCSSQRVGTVHASLLSPAPCLLYSLSFTCAQLCPADGQVTVRVVAILVDTNVEGAVHGLELQPQKGRAGGQGLGEAEIRAGRERAGVRAREHGSACAQRRSTALGIPPAGMPAWHPLCSPGTPPPPPPSG